QEIRQRCPRINRNLQALAVDREFDDLHQMLSSLAGSSPKLICTDLSRHVCDCQIWMSVSSRSLAARSASIACERTAAWEVCQFRKSESTASVWISLIG